MAADETRPDVLAACQASTPADGIMVGCEVEGPHERHRGTYVHDLGVPVEIEVSWLADEPAERVLSASHDERAAFRAAEDAAAAPAVTSPSPAPAKPLTATTEPGRGNDGQASSSPLAASREALGRLVRETWVRWAMEQPGRKPSWTVPWEDLDGGQREVDMRIGEAVAAAEQERDAEARTACEAQIARLERHLDTLAREHARHALAVSAHKGRADQQESRAVRAEKLVARFARYAEEYEGLAAQAAQGMRNADLVTELRRRIAVLERQAERVCPAEVGRLREALRAHMQSFTDPKGGGELCGGCLRPSPCPDAALAEGAARD